MSKMSRTFCDTITNMPDDGSGSPIKEQAPQQRSEGEPIRPPTTPDDPSPPATEAISRQEVQSEVKDIEDRVKRAELWMIWLTAAIAFSGFCAIGVGYMQWREIHSGSSDTHDLAVAAREQATKMQDISDAADKIRQAAENMAAQEKRLADDTETSLKVSTKQSRDALNASIAASRSDQRAWMGAADWTFTVNASDPVKGVVVISNVGKSPATNVICRISGGMFPNDHVLSETDIIYPDRNPIIKQGTAFPGTHFPLTAGSGPIQPELQKLWFQRIDDGDLVEYFWGYAIYDDAFGRNHWTHFCTRYRPKTKDGAPCEVYNETDDTKKKANY